MDASSPSLATELMLVLLALFRIWFLLMVAHFVCDYPLQGDFLARGKNHKKPIPGVPWFQCLFAHAAIHAGAVALVTRSLLLGFAELVCHLIIDYLKCDEKFGYNADQFLHFGCKILWVILYIVVP